MLGRLASSEVEVVEVVPSLSLPQHLVPVRRDLLHLNLNLIVQAAFASTERRATDSSVETLTVILDAPRFFAIAAPRVQFFYVLFVDFLEFGFESQRVFADGLLNNQLTQFTESLFVVAVLAATLRSAKAAGREALTVQLETLGLATSASGSLGGGFGLLGFGGRDGDGGRGSGLESGRDVGWRDGSGGLDALKWERSGEERNVLGSGRRLATTSSFFGGRLVVPFADFVTELGEDSRVGVSCRGEGVDTGEGTAGAVGGSVRRGAVGRRVFLNCKEHGRRVGRSHWDGFAV